MARKRTRVASCSDVSKRIAPYVHKKILTRSFVDQEDLPAILSLISAFSNVDLKLKKAEADDGTLDCVITVSGLLRGGVMRYELRSHGRRKQYYDPLEWIDELEMLDALIDD